ncbi:hypothetical protein AVEN_10516-1 [Araneus ventricosus]|uniref:Uncharacterized protein n=1 Tax=Araneus ventricosus TaxID=182803 RepID=A0A4Y2PT94_ARAVE|nr:hypothetical protein AVEN_10516-1 [Araneus ventricosus]
MENSWTDTKHLIITFRCQNYGVIKSWVHRLAFNTFHPKDAKVSALWPFETSCRRDSHLVCGEAGHDSSGSTASERVCKLPEFTYTSSFSRSWVWNLRKHGVQKGVKKIFPFQARH